VSPPPLYVAAFPHQKINPAIIRWLLPFHLVSRDLIVVSGLSGQSTPPATAAADSSSCVLSELLSVYPTPKRHLLYLPELANILRSGLSDKSLTEFLSPVNDQHSSPLDAQQSSVNPPLVNADYPFNKSLSHPARRVFCWCQQPELETGSALFNELTLALALFRNALNNGHETLLGFQSNQSVICSGMLLRLGRSLC